MARHWLGGKGRIVLVGFDMQGGYFFGAHPQGYRFGQMWPAFVPTFKEVAKRLEPGLEVVLGTPSALKCFPTMPLEKALA